MDYEKLGAFYLGSTYDPATKTTGDAVARALELRHREDARDERGTEAKHHRGSGARRTAPHRLLEEPS